MTQLEQILIDTIRDAPDPSAMMQVALELILSADPQQLAPFEPPSPAGQATIL